MWVLLMRALVRAKASLCYGPRSFLENFRRACKGRFLGGHRQTDFGGLNAACWGSHTATRVKLGLPVSQTHCHPRGYLKGKCLGAQGLKWVRLLPCTRQIQARTPASHMVPRLLPGVIPECYWVWPRKESEREKKNC